MTSPASRLYLGPARGWLLATALTLGACATSASGGADDGDGGKGGKGGKTSGAGGDKGGQAGSVSGGDGGAVAGAGGAGQAGAPGGSGGQAGGGGNMAARPKPKGPNIVLIMSDDQGCGDFGFMGNDIVKTPVLDKFEKEGTHVTGFHATPVCATTRSSLLTGKYHQRTGVRTNVGGWEFMHQDEITVAELLRDAGYYTGIFGKWHLGEFYPQIPSVQGFDEFLGITVGSSNFNDQKLVHNGKVEQTTGYMTDVLTDAAINFMDQHKQDRFFVYLPYNAPHTPLEAPAKYVNMYANTVTNAGTRTLFGMVTNMDENIGRVLKKVDDLGLTNETLVIFMSDNGPSLGGAPRFNCNLKGSKSDVYEGGTSVPLIFRWPGKIPVGKKVPRVTSTVDMFPTLLEYAQVARPASVELDGRSMKSLIEEANPSWPDRLVFMNFDRETEMVVNPPPQPGGAVWDGRYKLVNGTELYDLSVDKGETTNLAAMMPTKVKELDDAYLVWHKRVYGERPPRLPVEFVHDEANPAHFTMHIFDAGNAATFQYADNPAKYRTRGSHGDWLGNWQGTNVPISTGVNVVKTGTHDISLLLRCPEGSEGSRVRVSVGAVSGEGTISGCSGTGGTWVEKRLTTLDLKQAGKTTLSLEALTRVGAKVADVMEVIIRRP